MITAYLKNLFTSFSFLVLSRNRVFGIVLFLISFTNPSSGVLALVAYVSLVVLGNLAGLSREQMINGMYTYNSLLVGLSMGYLFEVSFLSVVFTIIASFFTLLLSFALQTIFSYYFRLPILNLPFTITATLVYLSSIRYGNLYTANTVKLGGLNLNWLPIWLSGFFKSTGILLFLPYDIIGIVVLIAMIIFSRVSFFLAVIGYYSGVLFLSMLKGSSYAAFNDLYSFNFILIALALGGLFLIPSVKTYLIAVSGVLVSVFILDAVDVLWSAYGIPVFAFPFVIVVLLILYVLIINKFPLVTTVFMESPEQNLEHYISYTARYNQLLPQPHLPFSGEWTVYQSFNGEWTHKGIWSNAVDFIVTDELGKSFRDSGKELNDYFSYNKPVLSPVSGKVVEVWNECVDNKIGEVDEQNNWGNYVLIYCDWGYYVEISHFAHGSVRVRTGEYVVQGQLLGMCGNSGYSPEPHIHIQCQMLPHIGAPTVPFSFTNCILENQCWFGGKLKIQKGKILRPVIKSRSVERRLQFSLDDQFTYEYFRNDNFLRRIRVSVSMSPDGSYYFKENYNGGTLFISNREGMFSFYRYDGSASSILRFFFLAFPRMPLTDENICWSDDINSTLLQPGAVLTSFLKTFNHKIYAAEGVYTREGADVVRGRITLKMLFKEQTVETSVKMHSHKGFETILVQSESEQFELRRVSV